MFLPPLTSIQSQPETSMLCDYDKWKLSGPPQWEKEADLLECEECGILIDPKKWDMTVDEMNPLCFDCNESLTEDGDAT